VWDFPRPPAIEPVRTEVSVRYGAIEIARSSRCLRVLETGSPPTYYVPPEDVAGQLLQPTGGRSRCEWKGEAHYWDLTFASHGSSGVAWSYPEPFPEFLRLAEHLAFYASRLQCFVDSIRAYPQPGRFYGGWVTPELVGPFKGEPGTEAL
jgi:uncharacterized protein (DUF427 family)